MTNEEKILAMLEKLDERQTRTESLLEKHSEMLEQMNERFDRMDERFDRMEARQDRMEARQDRMETRQDKVEILLENVIVPRLDALAEGQKTLLETLAPKSRVEALEEDVELLKAVIKTLSQRVNELSKAQ